MADTQSTIALNIGSQRISMALFEPSKSGGIVLKAYDSESILADPATEGSRAFQLRTAIADLAGRMKAKGKVRYAISGQSVFIRFVKLPPLDDDNIEQLVTFEAQQHVPFPLEEVVWDYEVLEAAGEKEVVIVAIKGDALDETNDGVNATGLTTAEVDVGPMALYNSFRAAYPGESEPVLLIDIGSKTSDLLYIEGNRFFTRSAAMGGSAVTAAIAKDFGVSFAEAESHKTQSGLVALGSGHTDQLDEQTAALATSIRNAMTRLATEIPRTTNYYRSQHNGNAPKKVFLAGGGANLPYVKEFLEEKLRLPVEYFNPLPAITVGKGVDAERLSKDAHTMGELIGLGLRGIGKTKINIDLVPAKVGQARATEKAKPFFIAAAAALLAGIALWGFFQMQAAGKARDEAAGMNRQLETLGGPAGAIAGLLSKEEELKSVADSYSSAEDDRTFWVDAIEELKASFASEAVWIIDFDPVANYDPFDPNAKGKSVVKADFATITNRATALDNVRPPESANPDQNQGEQATSAINALRVKGFWRKNSRNQNVVLDLLKKLGENAKAGDSHFKFSAIRDGSEVQLEDKQLAPVLDAAPAPEEFAAPFEIVIPLSRPVPFQ